MFKGSSKPEKYYFYFPKSQKDIKSKGINYFMTTTTPSPRAVISGGTPFYMHVSQSAIIRVSVSITSREQTGVNRELELATVIIIIMQIPANNPCTIASLPDRAGQLLFLFQSQRILNSSSDCRILALSAAIVWLAFQILSKFVVGRGVWAGATFYERARDAATQIWPGKRLLRAGPEPQSPILKLLQFPEDPFQCFLF